MKKRINSVYLLFALILIVIICSAFLYNNQNKIEKGTQMRLESIVGNSLYNIWHSYKTINSYNPEDLTMEKINELTTESSSIAVYSQITDRAVGTQLLSPIIANLTTIKDGIQKSYEKNNQFTNEDKEKYKAIIQFAGELHTLITDVYTVPDSVEGAKVSLKIDNQRKLVALGNRISHYISSLSL